MTKEFHMNNSKLITNNAWISLILRVAFASIFFLAARNKFVGGLDGVNSYFHSQFDETFLPWVLVEFHSRIIAFVEALIVISLLVGYKLNWAWIFTACTLVSLSFGQMVLGNLDNAFHDYGYTFAACLGLYFSAYDRFSVDGFRG
jgi:uncharacterized membrane protein YphA (DoxX/SURF4 family)